MSQPSKIDLPFQPSNIEGPFPLNVYADPTKVVRFPAHPDPTRIPAPTSTATRSPIQQQRHAIPRVQRPRPVRQRPRQDDSLQESDVTTIELADLPPGLGEPGLYRRNKTASDFYTAVTLPRSRKSRDSQRSTGGARSTPVTPTMLGQSSTHIATPSHVEGVDRAPSSGADISEGDSEVGFVGNLASPPYVDDSIDDLNDQAEVADQDTMQDITTNPMASLAKYTRERSLPLQSASAVHRVANALLDNNTARDTVRSLLWQGGRAKGAARHVIIRIRNRRGQRPLVQMYNRHRNESAFVEFPWGGLDKLRPSVDEIVDETSYSDSFHLSLRLMTTTLSSKDPIASFEHEAQHLQADFQAWRSKRKGRGPLDWIRSFELSTASTEQCLLGASLTHVARWYGQLDPFHSDFDDNIQRCILYDALILAWGLSARRLSLAFQCPKPPLPAIHLEHTGNGMIEVSLRHGLGDIVVYRCDDAQSADAVSHECNALCETGHDPRQIVELATRRQLEKVDKFGRLHIEAFLSTAATFNDHAGPDFERICFCCRAIYKTSEGVFDTGSGFSCCDTCRIMKMEGIGSSSSDQFNEGPLHTLMLLKSTCCEMFGDMASPTFDRLKQIRYATGPVHWALDDSDSAGLVDAYTGGGLSMRYDADIPRATPSLVVPRVNLHGRPDSDIPQAPNVVWTSYAVNSIKGTKPTALLMLYFTDLTVTFLEATKNGDLRALEIINRWRTETLDPWLRAHTTWITASSATTDDSPAQAMTDHSATVVALSHIESILSGFISIDSGQSDVLGSAAWYETQTTFESESYRQKNPQTLQQSNPHESPAPHQLSAFEVREIELSHQDSTSQSGHQIVTFKLGTRTLPSFFSRGRMDELSTGLTAEEIFERHVAVIKRHARRFRDGYDSLPNEIDAADVVSTWVALVEERARNGCIDVLLGREINLEVDEHPFTGSFEHLQPGTDVASDASAISDPMKRTTTHVTANLIRAVVTDAGAPVNKKSRQHDSVQAIYRAITDGLFQGRIWPDLGQSDRSYIVAGLRDSLALDPTVHWPNPVGQVRDSRWREQV